MLTWHPAGEVPVMCMRGGYSPSQGGGQVTPGHWDCLRDNCGHVSANTVRCMNPNSIQFLFYLLTTKLFSSSLNLFLVA